jgi:hypothetical protein
MQDALFIFIIKSFFNKENMYESHVPPEEHPSLSLPLEINKDPSTTMGTVNNK